MKLTIVLFLFLSPCVQQLAAAQLTLPEYCTDGTANANYIKCTYTNSATCMDCNLEFGNYRNNSTSVCAELSNDVCPFVRCCSKCEAEAKQYYECDFFADTDDTNPETQSCIPDCSAFPYGDNQNGVAEPCDAELGSWYACLPTDYASCLESCYDFESSAIQTTGNVCADALQGLCSFFECCPSCQSEYVALLQCEFESIGITFESTCSLSCNGVDFNGKQTNSGTGIKTSTAKNVLLILLSILLL